jgi:chromate transporter
MNSDSVHPASSSRALALYFLRLGTFGFGGPIALTGAMQRDLVQEGKVFTEKQFLEGLAFSQVAPGPLAAQLAMYLGYLHSGFRGATLTGVAFILPSFLMVLALSALYVRFGGSAWMQAVFYGVGAAVIALICRSALKLLRTTTKSDFLLMTIAAVLALTTALAGKEIVWLFLASGVVTLARHVFQSRLSVRSHGEAEKKSGNKLSVSLFPLVLSAPPFIASQGKLLGILLFFAKASLFVFGSGLAIVPFLHGGAVTENHWLTEQQFLDAVAVAMITPGPVVITVAFIGYLAGGFWGAVAAAVGVFLPVYLLVLLFAPHYQKWSGVAAVKHFISGVVAAAAGAIAGSVWILGKNAIRDLPTLLIAVVAFIILTRTQLPEPLLVLAAGVVGVLFRVGR